MKMHELSALSFCEPARTPTLPRAAALVAGGACGLSAPPPLAHLLDGLSPEVLVGLISVDGVLAYINRSCEDVLGYASSEVIGLPLEEVPWWSALPSWRDLIKVSMRRAQKGETVCFDIGATTPCGALTLEVMLKPLFDEAGAICALALAGRDVTERVRVQARTRYLISHDALTGLPNRQSFLARIDARRTLPGGLLCTHCILVLGLDRLNWINEALGATAGDAALKLFAQRVRQCLTADVEPARLDGDVFAVFMPGRAADAQAKAQALLRQLDAPMAVHGRSLYVSFSVGVAELDPTKPQASDAQALLQQAETALCHAKLRGPGSVQAFVAPAPSTDVSRLFLLSDLHGAIPRGELMVHYQPQWDARTSRVVGAEALVRWHHPEHGLVPPDRFIPLAEDSDLILRIGAWVLQQACTAAMGWEAAGFGGLHVSVNVSPRQLRDGDFSATVKSVLQETGLPAHRLVLEVTESVLMENVAHACALLASLREAGVAIALDDFGSGYSSLGQLRKLPIDVLKIDRSLVPDVAAEAESVSITRAIITMASSLKVQVLAEGVESRCQLDMLAANGCHLMQGYYLSRPLPDAELLRFLGAPPLTAANA